MQEKRCYFDIETSYRRKITVLGVYYETGKLVQLVQGEITPYKLSKIFKNTRAYSYNGSRFDIPVIRKCTGFDIESFADTRDLMYDCWDNNLKGGLKKVEQILDIGRETEGIDGKVAMKLWDEYSKYGRREALETLLKYNYEDVKNLEALRKKLEVD
ncbi:MAG: ribonuclease H-like domain-containing protein [Elusimicrobiota bacterium]